MPEITRTTRRRNRLYMRVIAFAMILAVAVLKPKVDEWLNSRQQAGDVQTADVIVAESTDDSFSAVDTSSIFKSDEEKTSSQSSVPKEPDTLATPRAGRTPGSEHTKPRATSTPASESSQRRDKANANRTASETARVTRPKTPSSEEPPPLGKLQLCLLYTSPSPRD